MIINSFDWDEINTEHIARHDVTPDEVEEVFDQRYLLFRTRDERYLAIGKSYDGRFVTVIFEKIKDGIRVVTARDTDYKERKLYKRKTGK